MVNIRVSTIIIKKSWNAKNRVNNGQSIDVSIEIPPDRIILAGWCSVFHQSTENFTIGKFTHPMSARMAAGRAPLSVLSNAFDSER